jgi:hypothetical protein
MARKAFKKFWIFMAIYVLESIGAVMAVQHSYWWMLPSVFFIALGLQLVEYYARNWEKFNE